MVPAGLMDNGRSPGQILKGRDYKFYNYYFSLLLSSYSNCLYRAKCFLTAAIVYNVTIKCARVWYTSRLEDNQKCIVNLFATTNLFSYNSPKLLAEASLTS